MKMEERAISTLSCFPSLAIKRGRGGGGRGSESAGVTGSSRVNEEGSVLFPYTHTRTRTHTHLQRKFTRRSFVFLSLLKLKRSLSLSASPRETRHITTHRTHPPTFTLRSVASRSHRYEFSPKNTSHYNLFPPPLIKINKHHNLEC